MAEEQSDQLKQTQQIKPETTKKKNPCIIIWFILLGLLIIGVVAVACIAIINRPSADSEPTTEGETTIRSILDIESTKPESNYSAKDGEDLTFRFTDLECNEDCSNVTSIKIGDQVLKAGEDYKVERGSIIITIFKKVLQALANGQHSISVAVGDTTITINISINNNSAVEEPSEEQPEEVKPADDGTSTSASSNTSDEQTIPTPTPTPTPTPEPTPTPTPEPKPTPTPETTIDESEEYNTDQSTTTEEESETN